MNNFLEIEKLLNENADLADLLGKKDPHLVFAAQNYLNLLFPPSYAEYLQRWGALAFGPNEYYGIIHENFKESGIPDGIWFTSQARRIGGLPFNLIVVKNNEGDEYDCVDTSTYDGDGECPIVVWDCPSSTISRVKAK